MSGPRRADVLARGAARLAGAGVATPERDARLLYRWAAGLDGAALAAALDDPAHPAELARFEAAIEARESRRPVAQIIGKRRFWGRDFVVTPEVLDPRPETETLIAAALELPAPARVLDLGTGSGCILLTLLAEWPEAAGIGVDRSPPALEVARRNAARLDLAERVSFVTGDWFASVTGGFDLIVSNPPYIAAAEIAGLAPEVRLFEPSAALVAGVDGLDAYRAILSGARTHLATEGALLLEIGIGQEAEVACLAQAHGWALPVPFHDMDGRTRVLKVMPAE